MARRRFFAELQNYMENENEGNESKTLLENFNCTKDKMEREMMEIKHRLYRSCFIYALSKLNVDNGLENLWKKENQIPLSSPATIDLLAQDPG